MATTYGTVGSDILHGTAGDDFLYGRAGNDTLYGHDGSDTLNGGGGNDRLDGGTGIDSMRGGLGNDIYVVDNQSDRVIELAGGGYDTVLTAYDYYLAQGSSIEVLKTTNPSGTYECALVGNEFANAIFGNAGGNWLSGGAGGDKLSGLGGHDVLTGGSGKDTLIGGAGQDSFVFTDSESRDVIKDFESGVDHIDLGYIIDEAAFDFIGGAAFSGQAGQGRFANGLFQLDSDGDGVADFSITMTGISQMQQSDFGFIASGWWDYPIYNGDPWGY